jgi:hypothetical protein
MFPQGQEGRSKHEKGHVLEGRWIYTGAVSELGFAGAWEVGAIHCGVAKE